MRLRRKLKNLNEAIEALDQKLRVAKGDTLLAYSRLSATELSFVKGEIESCITSRMYYLENYHCIIQEDGSLSTLHPVWDLQLLIEDAIDKERTRTAVLDGVGHSKIIVLKPRQTGGTEFANAVMCHCTFFTPQAFTLTVAQDLATAAWVQRKVNTAWFHLPWWLQPERQYHTKGEHLEFQRKDEFQRQLNPGLGSVFVTTHAERGAGVAIGKCQTPESVIWTSIGPLTLYQIWEEYASWTPVRVDPDGGEWFNLISPLLVYSHDSGGLTVKEVTSIYRMKYKGLIQSVDVGTVHIEKTPAHALLTSSGWQTQMRPKDICVRISDLPWPTQPLFISPDEAELLGWIVGEGSESLHGNTTVIPQKDGIIRQRIFELVARVAQPKTIHNIGEGNNRTAFVRFSSKRYKQDLVSRGYVWGHRSGTKEIPPFIFLAEKPVIVRFLQALFDAEASVTHVVEIGSKSKAVIEGVKFLLARFGISLRISAVWKKPTLRNPERYHYYRGCIGGPSLRKFADEIGFISARKKERLAKTASTLIGSNVEIAVEATELLREACQRSSVSVKFILSSGKYAKKQFLTRKSAAESLERLRSLCALSDVQLGRRSPTLRKFNQDLAYPYLQQIQEAIDSHFAFERVDRVSEHEYSGYVFDLEVASTHNYATSGIITHNTIRFFHGTEVSRWGSGEIYTADIEPSMNAPDTLAIMESASLDDRGFFVSLWKEASEDPDSDWVPVFLPVYRKRAYSLPRWPAKLSRPIAPPLTETELAARARVLSEESFRISDEFFNWRRLRVKLATKRDGNPYSHYAAYPMTPKEAFQSSRSAVFPRHKLDYQEQNLSPIVLAGEVVYQGPNMPLKRSFLSDVLPGQILPRREAVGTSRLHVWEEPQPGAIYYLSADTALGREDGDYSAASVWKVGRGMAKDVQVAEWHGKISPTDWAKVLYALGMWYQKTEIAVEYQAEGRTTGDALMNTLEYPNLYRPRSHDRIAGNQLANYLHWTTNTHTKPKIVTTMVEALLEDSVKINSQLLIDEMRKFGVTSIMASGYTSYAALDGHDDAVMAAMIGLFCLRETMPEFREQNGSSQGTPTHSARAAAGGVVYGVHDCWTRMMKQTRDLREAEDLCRKNPGWMIKPIVVSRANTAYSLIHHGRGVESQMYRAGIESKEILPAAMMAWKGARAAEAEEVEEINAWADGGEQGGWSELE